MDDVLRQDANAENAAFSQLNELLAAVSRVRPSTKTLRPRVLVEPDLVPATTDTTAAAEDATTTAPRRYC